MKMNDDAPDVAFTYDRLGRQLTAWMHRIEVRYGVNLWRYSSMTITVNKQVHVYSASLATDGFREELGVEKIYMRAH